MIRKNNQNQFLETLISMRTDAECNETAPATSFNRLHEDSEHITEMTSNSDQTKTSGQESDVNSLKLEAQIWNQRPLFSWRLR